MPGLPIAGRCGLVVGVLAAGLLAAPAVLAQSAPRQPSVETLMYHMQRDKKLIPVRELYRTSVKAAMLYSQCPSEYQVDEEKRQWMDATLYKDELRLREAYAEANKRLTYHLPSEGVLAAIDKYITGYREKEALELGLQIQKLPGKCAHFSMQKINTAYEKRRMMDHYKAAQAAAAEEKRRQEVPAEIPQTQP